jgi:hypothetical protein
MYKAVISFGAAVVIGLAVFIYMNHGDSNKVSVGLPQSGTFAGYVTDLKCKHNVNADCNRRCLASGEQPALLVDSTGDILRLKWGRRKETSRSPRRGHRYAGERSNRRFKHRGKMIGPPASSKQDSRFQIP